MPDAATIWKQALPKLRNSVTGVGVWTALNAVTPVLLEDGTLWIGFKPQDSELAGHLKLPATRRLMELTCSEFAGTPIGVRLIDGLSLEDIETTKRRDIERRRLQDLEMERMRAEMRARSSWDTVYEQLSRRFAAIPNKSMPQNRARFYEEALELIAGARQSQENWDDLSERNYARCIERLAQYVELPSTLVAVQIMHRAGEL